LIKKLSFITDIDDNYAEEEEGDEEHDTVDHVIRSTMAYSNFLYHPILDGSIDFTKPPLKISNLDDSKVLLDFRFHKADLQEIADLPLAQTRAFSGRDLRQNHGPKPVPVSI
jgi:hypothetical protein